MTELQAALRVRARPSSCEVHQMEREIPRGGRSGVSERLREQRTALPEHIGALRASVVGYAHDRGASRQECEHIALAVSEALSNSVLHAYVGRPEPGPVTVEVWSDERAIIVVVTDEGSGMVPRLDSPGLGIGLPLIAQMSDHLDIEDRDGQPGVRLRMTFALTG
jgi:serine/threonine-protein kinase RsbW